MPGLPNTVAEAAVMKDGRSTRTAGAAEEELCATDNNRVPSSPAGGTLQDLEFADDIDEEVEHFQAEGGGKLHQQHHSRGETTTAAIAATNTTTTTTRGSSVKDSSDFSDATTDPKKEAHHKQRLPRHARRTTGGDNSRRSDDRSVSSSAVVVKHSPSVCVGVFSAVLVAIGAIIIAILALVRINEEEDFLDRSVGGAGVAGACRGDATSFCGSETLGPPLLETILERGYLNCGLSFEQAGFLVRTESTSESTSNAPIGDDLGQEPTYVGMDVDLCRAIASAIFDGDSEAYRPVVFPAMERFTMLNSSSIDVLFRTTRTMQRQIYEPSINTGVQFSSPYFYDGLSFGGLAEFVDCAENGMFNETTSPSCADLKVCVLAATTHEAILRERFSMENIVSVVSEDNYYASFPSLCNVLGGEQTMIALVTLRQQGYQGNDYTVGTGVYSKEPLCLVTRRGDQVWSDFVESVLNSLLKAEEDGITLSTAVNVEVTDLFGPQFVRMFQNAVGVRGNYGELYLHNLEAIVPRAGLNQLSDGSNPRIWAFPFGDLSVEGPDLETVSPTIKAIRERGYLNCGLTTTIFFWDFFDEATRTYAGAAAELCRAVSAALFYGSDRTLALNLPFPLRATLLQEGKVDLVAIMSRGLEDDVKEPSIGTGVSLTSSYLFVGAAFGGLPVFVDCGERLDVFSIECQDLRICTTRGSDHEIRFSKLLSSSFLVLQEDDDENFEALFRGECNAILGTVLQQRTRFAALGADSPYVTGTRFFSTVSLSMASTEGDPVWSAFVDWIFNALVYGEENGIDQATASLMPRTNLLGRLGSESLYHAVNAVGNYGELYQRNFELYVQRAGLNALNDNTQARLFSI